MTAHTTSFWRSLAVGAAMLGAGVFGAASIIVDSAGRTASDTAAPFFAVAICALAALGGAWICWFLVVGRVMLMRAAREIAACHADQTARARAVHDWVHAHITYDHAEYGLIRKEDPTPGHQVAEAAAYFGTGVCSAMAEAVVRVALAAGLRAERVTVRIDRDGREVRHACARFTFPDGTWADSDPAYGEWDIRHRTILDAAGRLVVTKIRG